MAELVIDYNNLSDGYEGYGKLAKTLENYAEEIENKVTKKISGLPGNDNSGYASSASSNASAKINSLRANSQRFSSYAGKLEKFHETAKQADKNVETSIKSVARGYVGERSVWQGFCDFIWNAVCVDFLNCTGVGRFIKSVANHVWTGVRSVAEKVYDWFKHGKGKYLWNIVSAVAVAIGAVAAAISAVAAIATAGTVAAIVIAIIAAVAAIVGGIITIVNSSVKAYNSGKALAEDDPGVARYIGTIDGYSDAVAKYDFGDAEKNTKMKKDAQVIDTTKTVCDIIGIVKGVSDLGAVKSDVTGEITEYKFNKNNVMTNIKKKTGFDFDKGKYTFKGFFSGKKVDQTSSWYANENGYGGLKWFMNRYTSTQDNLKTFFDGAKHVENTMKTIENIDSAYNAWKKGIDFSSFGATCKSIDDIGYSTFKVLSGTTKGIGGVDTIVIKPIKGVKKGITSVKSWIEFEPIVPSYAGGGGGF